MSRTKIFLGFEPDDDDVAMRFVAKVKPGRFAKKAGKLTRLTSDTPDEKPRPEVEGRSRAERYELKLAAKVEQAHAKALKMSGNRFEVKNRDGHPRGYFPMLPPAQARADEVDGFVTDRLEGMIVYSSRGDPPRDAIPDDGEAEDWEMDW